MSYLLSVPVSPLHPLKDSVMSKKRLAGLHGLAMAKTYRQINPDARMLVIDQAQSIGGSWAKERLYPRLKTNNIFGSYEFADFPMVAEKYGVKPIGHIPGYVVHEYLCDYAAHFDIVSSIQLETKVDSAELNEDGTWWIKLENMTNSKSSFTVVTKKLVIATGLTSEPYIPKFPTEELFECPIVHAKQLKGEMEHLGPGKSIVVLGGNKSAWDTCYGVAQSGSQVHMVIRPSGGGPSYLWPRNFSWGLFTLSLGILSSTRAFTAFDPTPYGRQGPFGWLASFLHKTRLGQKAVQLFWSLLDSRIKGIHSFRSHPELMKLEPWTTPFWMGNSLSIHNYDTNWFDLVREGKITVHIANVAFLSKGTVHLSNEQTLTADAMVCCTGWKTECPIRFEPPGVAESIYLPDEVEENDLDIKIMSAKINNDNPFLASLPRRTSNAPPVKDHFLRDSKASYQLHRMVVPCNRPFLEKRSLAFIGMHSSVHATMVAGAQALWITAFFQDKLQSLKRGHVDFDAVRYEAALQSMYGRLRRPKETGGAASKYPDLVFDSIPYVDTLLRDLGLDPHRKNSWRKELFENYRPRDYEGIVEEWRTASRSE